LTPGAWRFAGANPFQRYDSYYGPGGLLQGYDPAQGPVYGLGGDNPTLMNPERRDAWMASDELLASDPELFGNATNLKVVSQDENGYTVMRKTADKEGTLIRIEKDPQTGEWVSKGAVGKEGWDTNAAQRFQNLGFGSVLGAALGGYGLNASGLVGPGVNGLASGASATEAAIGSALGGNGLVGGLGSTAAGAASGGMSSVGSKTPVIDSILGQSTIPGSAYAAPGMADSILPATTSLASPGAFSGILPATAPAWGSGLVAAPGITPLPGQPGSPPAPTAETPPATQTPPGGSPPGGNNGGFTVPTDLAGWAKLLGPALGGLLAGIEAKNANGQQNPQDEFTRDWARNRLNNGGLLAKDNQIMSGLLNKRYY
jgi:hypothetical protein